MTTDTIHTCSYSCERTGCIRAQRDELVAKVEALRAEVERVNSWNERVSVCRDHVADIVDGPCVICALAAAEARAERLAELLDRAYGYVPAGTLADQIHCALLRYQEEGNEQ